MKIIAVSDSHGSLRWVDKVAQAAMDAVCVFHLGDYVKDGAKFAAQCGCPVKCVAGNCDFTGGAPILLEETVAGIKVLAVHGHRYGVKSGLDTLRSEAVSRGAALCLYGHTHAPDISEYRGVWFVNPGSASSARGMAPNSYAVIEVSENGEICPSIVTV